jgi:hypothetical protein
MRLPPPRAAADDLGDQHATNVEAQLVELVP